MSHKEKTDKTFTSTEVGTLVESLRGEIRTVADGVVSLRGNMDDVKTRLSRVEDRLTGVEDAVRVAIPTIHRRLNNIEAKIGV